MNDGLSASSIGSASSGRFGTLVRFFDEIASTNSEASDWAAAGAPEGSLVAADHQTGGRGRWGRSWFSAPGKLLQFSLILRPDLEPARAGLLTAALGVATVRVLRELTALDVRLKWPNDAVIDGRKLAGMLVESTTTASRIDTAVCGIGINVHLEDGDIPDELRERATSIAIELHRAEKGTAPPRVQILARILEEIEVRYPAVTGDPSLLLAEASDLSCVLGRNAVIRFPDGSTIEGTADGFDPDGALRLIAGEKVTSVHVGEIAQLRTT